MGSDEQVPTDYDSAMALAMLWATGKLSHWNHYAGMGGYGSVEGATASAACAQADTAEVERWCAIARGFTAGELIKLTDVSTSLTNDEINTINALRQGRIKVVLTETPRRPAKAQSVVVKSKHDQDDTGVTGFGGIA